jgi:hypothetical protein
MTAYMENLDSPEIFKVFRAAAPQQRGDALSFTFVQVIKALCSYVNEDSSLPAPAGAVSKVTRRAQFRAITCPSVRDCGKFLSLTQHMLAFFEENLTEVIVCCRLIL